MSLTIQNHNRSYSGARQSGRRPLENLLLYIRTARHLEPVQIYSRFRLRPRLDVAGPYQRRVITGQWTPPIAKRPAQTGPNRFRFLNQEREIRSWDDHSASNLWLYNLHYFEHVDSQLVDRWIAENPVGESMGWDPYPTSLRIANWCKWILGGASPGSHVCESICVQAAWLERRLERHLLANHLLANAKALLFAGCLFRGDMADRGFATGLRVLQQELPRQILADGAHTERSPMYHSIVLEDLLDLSNLRQTFDCRLPDLSGYTGRMLGWLDRMTHPDGGISFFNDAALGVASTRDLLESYARRMGVPAAAAELSDSGYRRLDNGPITLIFDAAELGPDYQPGHGHADALSFELSCGGRRVFVNSGTSTYDDGPVRSFERGTSAHNTIRIDGVDQSEMWGSFRVARRAHPFDLRTDGISFVEAAHDGYQRLRPGITHRRRIVLGAKSLVVRDSLEGKGHHNVELFFHIAPGANPEIQLDPRMIRKAMSTTWRTGFNCSVPNTTVVGSWTGECPVQFKTRIDLTGLIAEPRLTA